MIKCPHCQRKNQPGRQKCAYCQMPIDTTAESQTTQFDEENDGNGFPKWGSAKYGPMTDLVVEVIESRENFIFDISALEAVDMGRQDPHTGKAPDIDLSTSKAQECGVSRHHASIIHRNGALHIVDNTSANGTFLNGLRLVAQQPRILRDGDEVRLGKLSLRVTFRPRG